VILEALGTITARNTAVVRSRVEGPLLRILFREGQDVTAGDLLARSIPGPSRADRSGARTTGP
jgi:multidrug efflux system membrane fusion protein